MAKKIDVFWRGEVVGSILEPKFDNYHLYGEWKPVSSPTTHLFIERITAGKLARVLLGDGEPPLYGTIDMPPDDEGEIEFSMFVAAQVELIESQNLDCDPWEAG